MKKLTVILLIICAFKVSAQVPFLFSNITAIGEITCDTNNQIVIGDQTWMGCNLNIDDGQGGIYPPNNDTNNISDYGYLYTQAAAIRIANTLPGWRLPIENDILILGATLGGWSIAGGKIKETGEEHWNSPNTATNSTNFSAVGAGIRTSDGSYYGFKSTAYLWYDYNASTTYVFTLNYNTTELDSPYPYTSSTAVSIRLIKE